MARFKTVPQLPYMAGLRSPRPRPAAAFIRDAGGRHLWANHAYAHLYGTTPAHVIGQHIEEVDLPVDAARVLALDRDVLTRAYWRPHRNQLVCGAAGAT